MAGVAYNGSSVAQSTKGGHVTYNIERYSPPTEDQSGYWYGAGSGSTNAQISSSGVSSSSTVYVNSKAVTTVGDRDSETWVASPSVPSSSGSTRYVDISPGTSGSGQGTVSTGSSTVFVSGKAVASIGSTITTHLGTTTTITSGSSNVFVN
ncbi:hypothetical protein [Paenibacillus taichungensis]